MGDRAVRRGGRGGNQPHVRYENRCGPHGPYPRGQRFSAHDRAQTIKTAIDASSCPEDLARPGHVFPLRARPGGVLERRGHTEAAVDLAMLAGLCPAGVICEIINDDGTMARLPDLVRFCKRHGLLMITVAELARYRLDSEHNESPAAIHDLLPMRLRGPQLSSGTSLRTRVSGRWWMRSTSWRTLSPVTSKPRFIAANNKATPYYARPIDRATQIEDESRAAKCAAQPNSENARDENCCRPIRRNSWHDAAAVAANGESLVRMRCLP
jgi:hypothetical protein